MLRRSGSRSWRSDGRGQPGARRERWAGWALAGPAAAGLAVFAIYPLAYLVLLALSKSSLGQPFRAWVGLANFRQALGDETFVGSLVRSVGFAVPVSLLELALGLGIALLLQDSIRGGHLIRTAILLPLMTPPVMVAVAWRLILAPAGGLLNGLLLGTGLVERPVSFLGSSLWAFPSIGLADLWQWTPFVALMSYAALQGLPREVHEAAALDGASGWNAFWLVSLPLLLPALSAIFLLRLVLAFKLFDLVYMLTFGGPGVDTTVATFLIYRVGLQEFNTGYAAAMTLIFGLVVGVVTLPVTLLRDRLLRMEQL